MNNEKHDEESELEFLKRKLTDYEDLKMEFELLNAALTVPEAYYGIVSNKIALELESLKCKLADATEIIRSLEFSTVYDWGNAAFSPVCCCPFCGAKENEDHKTHCSVGSFLKNSK